MVSGIWAISRPIHAYWSFPVSRCSSAVVCWWIVLLWRSVSRPIWQYWCLAQLIRQPVPPRAVRGSGPRGRCRIIGLMARFGSEKIRGHGIPEAIEAILLGRSRLDLKVAILDTVLLGILIGSGGPFGARLNHYDRRCCWLAYRTIAAGYRQ